MIRNPANARQASLLDFAIESLEDRRMMAGNVSVDYQRDGDLVLRGDNADNHVVVRAHPHVIGSVRVEGLDNTLIEGANYIDLHEPVVDLEVYMKRGNNGVHVERVHIDDDLIVRFGRGHDHLELNDSRIGDDVSVRTSKGDDDVIFRSLNGLPNRIYGDVYLNMSSGADDVIMDYTYVEEDVDILGGSGADLIILDDSRLGEDLDISGSRDNDLIGISNVLVAESIDVDGSSGDDHVFLTGVFNQSEGTEVELGSGNDLGLISRSYFVDLEFDGDSGDDLMLVSDLTGVYAEVDLGSGDDIFAFSEWDTLAGELDGERGYDEWYSVGFSTVSLKIEDFQPARSSVQQVLAVAYLRLRDAFTQRVDPVTFDNDFASIAGQPIP